MSEKLIQKVIDVATAEVGVREIGTSNTGKRVREYQNATTHGGTGWAWCAAFIAWIIEQVFGDDYADDVWLNSASCDEILRWGRKLGIISTKPTKGSMGLYMRTPDDATHIFLVKEVEASKRRIKTVEGNTNEGGSHNGIGVFERYRPIDGPYLYVDWWKLISSVNDKMAEDNNNRIIDLVSPTGVFIGKIELEHGRSIVAAWKWASWFKADLGWSMAAQTAMFNNKVFNKQPADMRIDEDGLNRSWYEVRDLAKFFGFKDVKYTPGRVELVK